MQLANATSMEVLLLSAFRRLFPFHEVIGFFGLLNYNFLGAKVQIFSLGMAFWENVVSSIMLGRIGMEYGPRNEKTSLHTWLRYITAESNARIKL